MTSYRTLIKIGTDMQIEVHADRSHLGARAAGLAADAIRAAIAEKGQANVVLATGASQFDTLHHLVGQPVDWSAVTVFHLDEYVGLPPDHPASFRRYLRERFVDRIPGPVRFVPIEGDAADPAAEARRLSTNLAGQPVDVCLAGIGENAHLAFNDPPADFETRVPYIIVTLDDDCRRQQYGEGWFDRLEDVPRQAISMTVRQILESRLLVLSVPDARKAAAVKHAVEGPVTPDRPASIVREHAQCYLLLDPAAAADLADPPAVRPV